MNWKYDEARKEMVAICSFDQFMLGPLPHEFDAVDARGTKKTKQVKCNM